MSIFVQGNMPPCDSKACLKKKKILRNFVQYPQQQKNEMCLTWIPYFELGVGVASSGPGAREVATGLGILASATSWRVSAGRFSGPLWTGQGTLKEERLLLHL